MSDKLRRGDVVQLKSGGPKMTLLNQDAHDNWVAEWFVGDDLRQAIFDPEMIEKIDETYKFAAYPNRATLSRHKD